MIDGIDLKILTIMQHEARIANAEVARQVGLTPSAILERIRKLERSGVIQAYETKVSHFALGLNIIAFVWVKLKDMASYRATGAELAGLREVMEVHNMAGEECFLVKTAAKDTKDLARILEKINKINNVRATRTNITLDQYKETFALPLEQV
jgi:Lrp/AsnC family leucine-responsive transcriptional regulator